MFSKEVPRCSGTILDGWPLIGQHSPNICSLNTVTIEQRGTEIGLVEWISLRQSTSRCCKSIFRIKFLAGDCYASIGMAHIPRKGEEEILETRDLKQKIWTICLSTGGRYIADKQEHCLNEWTRVEIGDIVSLFYFPKMRELFIGVEKKNWVF